MLRPLRGPGGDMSLRSCSGPVQLHGQLLNNFVHWLIDGDEPHGVTRFQVRLGTAPAPRVNLEAEAAELTQPATGVFGVSIQRPWPLHRVPLSGITGRGCLR